jgi:hypothetical protein
MRVGTRLRLSRTLLAPFAALLASGIAGAAQADALTYDAVHKIRFSLNGEIAEVSASGSGVAIVNGGVVGGPLQTLELTAPFAEIDATALGSSQMGLESVRFKDVRLFRTMAPFAGPGGSPGVFAPIATAAMSPAMTLTRNTLPVGGSVTLCKSFGCGNPIVVPLSQSNAMEAVGVGVGGTFMESYSTFPPVFLTVEGQPWTIHKAMVDYDTFTPSGTGTGMLTETGFAHGPTMSPASTAVPGGVYGWPKNNLHWNGINESIADLHGTTPSQFAIVDGIVGMEGNGPIQGSPKSAGVLVAGADPVAVDCTCCRIMGIDPDKIDYIKLADSHWRRLEANVVQIGETIASVQTRFELLPIFDGIRLGQA